MTQAAFQHEAFYQDLAALLDKHAGALDAREMLAITSNVVGKVMALQDRRSMTREIALQIIIKNIEMGNRHVISEAAYDFFADQADAEPEN